MSRFYEPTELEAFLNAAKISAIFTDQDLNILNFTSGAENFFLGSKTALGEYLFDLEQRFDYPDLEKDLRRVLDNSAPLIQLIEDLSGSRHLIRMHKFRNGDKFLAITFVEIPDHLKTEERKSE